MHFYKNCITTIPTNFYFSENKTKFIFFFLQTNLLLLCITDQSITKIINIIWSKQAGFGFFGGKSWKKNQQQLCNMKTERKLGQQWQDFLPFLRAWRKYFQCFRLRLCSMRWIYLQLLTKIQLETRMQIEHESPWEWGWKWTEGKRMRRRWIQARHGSFLLETIPGNTTALEWAL